MRTISSAPRSRKFLRRSATDSIKKRALKFPVFGAPEAVVVKFDVAEPKVELSDIAMNEKLLHAMASTSGGHFVREEDLNGLPELVASQTSGNVTFKKIPLAFAPIILALMILIACIEWLWRRKLELK